VIIVIFENLYFTRWGPIVYSDAVKVCWYYKFSTKYDS